MTSFQDFKEWKDHGLKKGYGQKSASKIKESKKINERSWYRKGSREKWLREFQFNNSPKKNRPFM